MLYRKRRFHTQLRTLEQFVIALSVIGLAGFCGVFLLHAQQAVPIRSIQLSNSMPGAAASYELDFVTQGTGTVGSIRISFCDNSPLVGAPCTPPAGFDAAGASLAEQSGMTGFTVVQSQAAHEVLLTRNPASSSGEHNIYKLDGVKNPTGVGSFYARIQTYGTPDGSGKATDYGGVALATANGVTISTTVPPYMLFCAGVKIAAYDCATATGSDVNFGELSAQATRSASMQLLLSTNADNGYNIHVAGTTLTSGTNVIAALPSPNPSRTGVSQFGINLRANRTPLVGQDVHGPGRGAPVNGYEQADMYKFNSGDVIASSTQEDDLRLYTVSAITNVVAGQPAGIYVSTLTFVATASF